MSAKKILPPLFIIVFGLFLAACGGGGGGGSSGDSAPTYPVAQAYSQLLSNGFDTSYTVAMNAGPFAGDQSFHGNYTVTPLSATSFEGQNAMGNTTTLTLLGTIGGTEITFPSTIYQEFYDSNYNRKGYSGDFGYEVVNTINPLPTAAHVNDTGTWYSSTTYNDQSKTTQSFTTTVTYKIETDSSTSVIFETTAKSYDSNQQVVLTVVNRYRITDKGTAKLLSVHIVEPGVSVPDFQYNLQ